MQSKLASNLQRFFCLSLSSRLPLDVRTASALGRACPSPGGSTMAIWTANAHQLLPEGCCSGFHLLLHREEGKQTWPNVPLLGPSTPAPACPAAHHSVQAGAYPSWWLCLRGLTALIWSQALATQPGWASPSLRSSCFSLPSSGMTSTHAWLRTALHYFRALQWCGKSKAIPAHLLREINLCFLRSPLSLCRTPLSS